MSILLMISFGCGMSILLMISCRTWLTFSELIVHLEPVIPWPPATPTALDMFAAMQGWNFVGTEGAARY